ncbi:MAG: hypothetical protein OXF77_00880, partial [Thaumarchaeota archaeon]|nr:hypothetical protein [Nitrososphaerota archaeon]
IGQSNYTIMSYLKELEDDSSTEAKDKLNNLWLNFGFRKDKSDNLWISPNHNLELFFNHHKRKIVIGDGALSDMKRTHPDIVQYVPRKLNINGNRTSKRVYIIKTVKTSIEEV